MDESQKQMQNNYDFISIKFKNKQKLIYHDRYKISAHILGGADWKVGWGNFGGDGNVLLDLGYGYISIFAYLKSLS